MRLTSLLLKPPFYAGLIITGLLGLTACSPTSNEQVATQPSKSDTIRIATEGAYPPFNYTKSDGTLAGFDVDVANAICAQMQRDCKVIAQDWDGIIPGLLAGKYDAIVAGMSVTPERLQKVGFTEPYFTNTMVWIAKNDSGFDANNISNKNLGGQRATTLGAYLQDNFKDKNGNTVNLYDTYENAYLDLKSGRVDAVLAEKVSAMDWLPSNPDYGIIGDEMDNDDNIAIAVRQNDALIDQFNSAIATLKATGELTKIEQANFNFTSTNPINAPIDTQASTKSAVAIIEPHNVATDHVTLIEGQGVDLDGATIVQAEEAIQVQ